MATKLKAKIQPVKTGNKLVSNSAISGVNNYINALNTQNAEQKANADAQAGDFGYNRATGLDAYNDTYNKYAQGMKDAYTAQAGTYQTAKDTAISQANTNAAKLNNNAYVNMMQKRLNNRQIASNRGIRGGGVERMDINNANNYNMNVGTNNAAATASIANANTDYMNKMASAQSEYQKLLAEQYSDLAAANIERKDTLKANADQLALAKQQMQQQVWADTSNRYRSVKAYKKAIKKAKSAAEKRYLQAGLAKYRADKRDRKDKAAQLKAIIKANKKSKKK